MSSAQRLSRIIMICREPDRLAGFYEAAFGFTPIGAISIREPALAELIGVPEATARVVTLRLGEQEIALAGIWPRPFIRATSRDRVLSFSIARSWFPIWRRPMRGCRRRRAGIRSRSMDRRCCPLRPAASPPINCAIPMVIRLNSLLTRATPFPHDGKIFGRARASASIIRRSRSATPSVA